MKIKTAISVLSLSFILFLLSLLNPLQALAAGTVTGTFKGPHGETTEVDYTFTKGSSTVTGTTNSSGFMSQSFTEYGEWSLSVSSPDDFEYTDTITISRLPVNDGDSFDLGTIQFHYMVPDGTDDDLEEFMALPSICSQTGDPVLIRTDYEDEAKGSFLYQGRGANVIVVADSDSYTVTVDYSFIEGQYQNDPFSDPAYVETAASQGNGVYKATHTLSYDQEGGGMPIVKIDDGGGNPTYGCLTPGPVNLDIRNFFTGSDTTDFTSVSDFRTMTNFTMHQANEIKIVFAGTVNMLDPTVQRFMKSIGDKMTSSSGFLDLDADAVLGLKNAGAVITMYGLNLNNPKILVDGAEDTGGVTSGISYDQTTGSLTFNTAHFTSFQAVETSSGLTAPVILGCTSNTPENAPELFQIDRNSDKATLYFVPASGEVTSYYIAYGLDLVAEQFGAQFDQGKTTGVLSYKVSNLDPNTTYYFKVRAGNDCAAGPWSSSMKSTAGSKRSGLSSVDATISDEEQSSIDLEETSGSNDQSISKEYDLEENQEDTLEENVVAKDDQHVNHKINDLDSSPKISFWQRVLNLFRSIVGKS